MTFDMKVKADGGPGAAGNTTCLTLLRTKHECYVQLAGTDVSNRTVTSLIAASMADRSATPRYVLSHEYKLATQSAVVCYSRSASPPRLRMDV